MNEQRRRISRDVIIVASVTTPLAAISIVCGISVVWSLIEPGLLRSRLRNADHHVLSKACRQLSRQVVSGELSAGTYRVRPRSRQDQAVSRFPQAIRDLGPAEVRIEPDGVVQVCMSENRPLFGVNAYPEGYPSGKERGDRELVPHLWYWDDA